MMIMSGGVTCGGNPILVINPTNNSYNLPPATTRLMMMITGINNNNNYYYRRDLSFCPSISNNNNNSRMMNINNKKRNTVIFMQWQDCKVKMDVQVPVSTAYRCYSDREAIPKWMPFISAVKILEDKPDLSRWSLKYKAFGQDIEFSWLARNMQPIKNQKIHWRSLEGLPNRGAVRFYPKGPSSCTIELTVSYEVPQLLAPVASALQPFLESLLIGGLERFAEFASSYSTNSSS